MPDVVYVPVLKGRQGEFAALASLQPTTRQHILPIVEIVPGPADEPAELRANVQRAVRKLSNWAGGRLLLDASLLATDVELRDGLGAVGFATASALGHSISATPVIGLNSEDLAHRDARAIHAEWRSGVAIRLTAMDLDEEAEDIDQALTEVLRRLAVGHPDADLVLDFGPVNGDPSVRAGSRLAADLLRELTAAEEWREIIVTAGAFPTDLSSFGSWTIGEPARYDAALYDHLQQRRRLRRLPVFGDYAVAHPLLATGPPFLAVPQLRYTVAGKWLILKGRGNDPRGHEQFREVCETISRHPEFVGAALGNADARIADPHSHEPGNASTWQEISTTHHLDYVVQRLTTLREP